MRSIPPQQADTAAALPADTAAQAVADTLPDSLSEAAALVRRGGGAPRIDVREVARDAADQGRPPQPGREAPSRRPGNIVGRSTT